MTKEELEKEAEESAKKFFGKPTDLVDLDNLRIFKNGYLAGAEPREKRIDCLTLACENYREEMEKNLANATELEKENAELQDKLNNLSSVAEVRLANWQRYEKENAELKERNRELLESCEGATMMYKDLCKAKEHIENLLYYVKQCTCERSNYAEIEQDIKEAEQFIEE